MHEVIKHGDDKRDWLSRMVSFQEQMGITTWDWERRFHFWMIKLLAIWSLVRLECPIPHDLANRWAEEHGEWEHGSNHTRYGSAHNELGMAYAWYVSSGQGSSLEEIELNDSPDFRAKCQGKLVMGDIGVCTPLALFNALQMLTFHSLWISVLDYSTQVVVEFLYSPSHLITYTRTYNLFGELTDREEAIRHTFWCPHCNK